MDAENQQIATENAIVENSQNVATNMVVENTVKTTVEPNTKRKRENIVERDKKRVTKRMRTHQQSIQNKIEKIIAELITTSKWGNLYKTNDGKLLDKVMAERRITDREVHSIELNSQYRIVYELFPGHNPDGTDYIFVTDVGNHEYRGISYYRRKSDSGTKQH